MSLVTRYYIHHMSCSGTKIVCLFCFKFLSYFHSLQRGQALNPPVEKNDVSSNSINDYERVYWMRKMLISRNKTFIPPAYIMRDVTACGILPVVYYVCKRHKNDCQNAFSSIAFSSKDDNHAGTPCQKIFSHLEISGLYGQPYAMLV